ncbi:hypothetical protein BJV77DRAFT_199546 [Russula vinacea]|nr:hypothetical protein BJV77DRAFT_199546 [Russula vinacea]
MPVDTVVDLRQRAGDLAHRLGYLSHFMPAAQELLDIIHHLSSEILLRHNRKIVTLVEISRATLSRAGLKLYSFTSCVPALRNYKTLYFDILRALRERQDVIVDCDNLRDRVSRLLMPLSTWLVIHQGDASSATPFSTPASLNRDATPPLPPEKFQLQHRKSSHIQRPPATAQPATAAPEELMPPPSSLPHRFQQPPSTTPRGWHLLQADHTNQTSGVIRMARTRTPRTPPPCAADPQPDPGLEPETRLAVAWAEPPTPPPVIAQRRSQRFGIFLTAANGGASGGRRRGLTVPRSSP